MDDGRLKVFFETLAPWHKTDDFDCGIESLNIFLRRHALNAPLQGLSQTWIGRGDNGKILGYYTLAVSVFTRSEATPRVGKGMPNYDIPCVLLARLGVDRAAQGQGFGRVILEQAMRKALLLGRQPKLVDGTPGLPLRALIVHALNDEAASFYRHHGFESSPTDPVHLLMLLKDIARSFP